MPVRASDRVTLAKVLSPSYVRMYYVLQGSALAAPALPTANPPVAPWVLIEPTYTEGSTDTLYTTMLSAYGTAAFEYGPVQKASSYEAAKVAYNLAVNTRNVNTALENLTNSWKVPGATVTIDGANITANTIVASQIGALAITAKHTITGAVIQTAVSGARVRLDSTGLNAYDLLSNLKTTVGTDGILRAVGAVISGVIKSADSGQRVELDSNSAIFYSGISANSTAIKSIDNGTTGTAMMLSAGSRTLMVGTFNLPSGGAAGAMTASLYISEAITAVSYNDTDNENILIPACFKMTGAGAGAVALSTPSGATSLATYGAPELNRGMGAYGTNYFTISRTGWYEVSAGCNFSSGGALGRIFMRINKNSTNGNLNQVAANSIYNTNSSICFATVYLVAGDIMRGFVVQESTVTRSTTLEISNFIQAKFIFK